MSGINDLESLLAGLDPMLAPGVYVFVTFPSAAYGDRVDLEPIAVVAENEGLTMVVPEERAEQAGAPNDGIFRWITLQVHSDLNAVGLTAAVADELARQGISANIIAGFYHDHILVPASRAEDALSALKRLSATSTRHG